MIDETFDLPVPNVMNKKIINYLGEQPWSYGSDNDTKYKNSFYDIVSNPLIKDSGQTIVSYLKHGQYRNDLTLNFFGEYIFSLIQERSKFKIKDLGRLYWNLYTPSSESKSHFDDGNVGKFISAVYNLHTNDGGTQIENEFIPFKEGQVIIFKSEKIHKAIAPKTNNLRLSLNIIMELDV